MRVKRIKTGMILVVAMALCLVGCAPRWELPLTVDGQPQATILGSDVAQWAEQFPGEVDDDGALLLERVLWEYNVDCVDALAVDGRTIPWSQGYDQCWLLPDGTLKLGDERLHPAILDVTSPPEMADVSARVYDVAPSVAVALGLEPPERATGGVLADGRHAHVLYIFIDGLSLRRYRAVGQGGAMPYLSSLGEPRVALSVFPSVTKVSSAAMLTGAPPQDNGVRDRSTRKTDVETILDIIAASGRTSVSVEGDALSFNMPNTELVLSGDRDGNGSSDDNTFANAMRAIEQGMPDFLWVHFHGVDDYGHTYGVGGPEEPKKMTEVDGYVRQIGQALPPDTLVIIGSDHGMHNEPGGERAGNHGTLRPEDMLIPLWVFVS